MLGRPRALGSHTDTLIKPRFFKTRPLSSTVTVHMCETVEEHTEEAAQSAIKENEFPKKFQIYGTNPGFKGALLSVRLNPTVIPLLLHT